MECELLIKCLIIISRHFDNIPIIIKTDFISNTIAIATFIIKYIGQRKNCKYEEINFIKSFSYFLEVIYDPYFTWRNFLKRNFVDFKKMPYYNPTQLNVEIVPFIYDCFQYEKIVNLPEIGSPLIHILGSIISGSQVSLIFKFFFNFILKNA